jgi:putative peptide zinc metalloprotease protein
MFIVPASKRISFILSSPIIRSKRSRAIFTTGFLLACIAALAFFMPIPFWTRAEGVIWVPEKSIVRAGTDGFVDKIIAKPGTVVRRDDPLIQCSDPLLPSEVRVLKSRLLELKARYDAQVIEDRVQAELTKEEMATVTAELERAKERVDDLTIRSTADGTFIVPVEQDLPGRFVRQGQMIAYVVEPAAITARVVVPQADVDLVRKRTRKVQVRLTERISEIVPALIKREVPAATDQLPSMALGSEGGGEIAIDPRDAQGVKAFQKIFQFDIELLKELPILHIGGRAYVRFDHGKETFARQIYRGLRRLFLKRFQV